MLNQIYAGDPRKNRSEAVPADTVAGTPLIIDDRPCVTVTARSDATATETLSDGTTITYNIGGVGSPSGEASVAYDGTYLFDVTGAATDTDKNVAVYITSAGALTLTDTGNTLFGYTDYPTDFTKEAGKAPVRIGA